MVYLENKISKNAQIKYYNKLNNKYIQGVHFRTLLLF